MDILRVAFEGERGAYSEDAIAALFPSGAEPVPSRTVLDVACAVANGGVDAGVLPVENTLAGSVVASYDALAQCATLHAVAETVVGIHHCLLAPPGATLEGLERVESHPVALAQCTRFLALHADIHVSAAADTAGSARDVAAAGDPRRAAIASRAAAERYGLVVLVERIEDRPDNQTRFLAVTREPAALAPGIAARTSIIFTTANKPGALLHALSAIAEHKLNMSKLESRPTGQPWTYRFFADFEHEAGDDARDRALGAMKEATLTLRVLGTYARAATNPA
jgi:prephenate dehydratase